MIFRNVLLIPSTALALTLFQSGADAQEKHTIKLKRDFQVGQNFEVDHRLNNFQMMEIEVDGNARPGPADKDKNDTVVLTGTDEVIAVKNGFPSKVRLTIKKFTSASLGELENAVLEPGTIVTISYGEKVSFSIDGEPINLDTAKLLGDFYKAENDGIDIEKAFGSTEKKAVGATWTVDTKVAAAGLAKKGVKISPEDIEGKMTLKGVVSRGGVRCLQIEGNMVLKKIPAQPLPGFRSTGAGGQMTISGFFPTNSATQPIELSTVSSFQTKATRQANGVKLDTSINGTKKEHKTRKQVK